jgi:hypothetical protein
MPLRSICTKIALGLNVGLVPPRVDASVKAGLLELVEHAACQGGWSTRRSAALLGLDHVRVLRWQTRAVVGRLADAKPGPEIALHALLPWEREAIVKIAEEWMGIDRSHRKLAHRGSRLESFYASESTVLRVLQAAGVAVPERPAREWRPRREPSSTGGRGSPASPKGSATQEALPRRSVSQPANRKGQMRWSHRAQQVELPVEPDELRLVANTRCRGSASAARTLAWLIAASSWLAPASSGRHWRTTWPGAADPSR